MSISFTIIYPPAPDISPGQQNHFVFFSIVRSIQTSVVNVSPGAKRAAASYLFPAKPAHSYSVHLFRSVPRAKRADPKGSRQDMASGKEVCDWLHADTSSMPDCVSVYDSCLSLSREMHGDLAHRDRTDLVPDSEQLFVSLTLVTGSR